MGDSTGEENRKICVQGGTHLVSDIYGTKVRSEIIGIKYRFAHNFVKFYSISFISLAYQRYCRALHFRRKTILKKVKKKMRK